MISQNMLSLFAKKLENLSQTKANNNQSQKTHQIKQKKVTSNTSNIILLEQIETQKMEGVVQKQQKNNIEEIKIKSQRPVSAKPCAEIQIQKQDQTQKCKSKNFFGFRVYPSPQFPDQDKQKKVGKSKEILEEKNQLVHMEQEINEAKNFIESVSNVYLMNNLISLYGKVHGNIVRLYIKQVSKKHKISYNSIITSFGIQYLIVKFYKSHDLACLLSPKYILSQITLYIPPFIAEMCISNWFIIRKICQAVFKRFNVQYLYTDDWLITTIKKKSKLQRQNGNNIERILLMHKSEDQARIKEPAHEKQVRDPSYKNIKSYLLEHESFLTNQVIIQDTDDEMMQESDRPGIASKLKLYKELKEKSLKDNLEAQNEKKNKSRRRKEEQLEQKQYQLVDFYIFAFNIRVPHDAIILDQYKQQQSLSESSKTQIQQSCKSERQGNKRATIKEKAKQKELERSQRKLREKKQSQKLVARKTIARTIKIAKTIAPLEMERMNDENVNVDEQNCEQNVRNEVQMEERSKIEEALKQMDLQLFKFHDEQPDFSMGDLVKQIYRILKQAKVDEKYQQEVTTAWFKKYQGG